jgi:2-keto-3-deoxy-L-rhamnonate aldolase RhmA
MARNPLRTKLQANENTIGLWVTIECASIAEIAVALQLDWITIDMEHGHLGFKEVMAHIRAVRSTSTADYVKRVLDMGAHGVILPLLDSRADVERAFSFGRYPPEGVRGVGGERAFKWGMGFHDYVKIANEETLLIPLIETRAAAAHIDEILAVPGLEAIFFGPADLSATSGYLGEWEGPGLAQQILDIKDKAKARGIAAGIMAVDLENSQLRREQGFDLIGLGTDATLLVRALRENLRALGRDDEPQLWF